MEQGHGIGTPGNGGQDPETGLKQLFPPDKTTHRRQEEIGVGGFKEGLNQRVTG